MVRQLMGRNSLRPLGCVFLGMRDAMTRNHVSWKLSDENIACMFLARHKICSVRARLALFQPGQTLPDITWGDFKLLGAIIQRSPPFQNTLVFGLKLQLALSRNSDLKNVCVETPDGRRRRFLPKNIQPIEVLATLPLHRRSFRLACFPQKLLVSVERGPFASATRDDCTVSNATVPSDRR